MFTLTIEDKSGLVADEFCFNHGTYLIGRVEGNDIILPSSKVSRQHARIFIRDQKCYIEDLGSSNGVIVDGQRIQGERDLGSASQIRIGDYYLYLALNKEQDNNQHDVVSTHIVSQDENSYKLVRVGDGFAGEIFPLSEAQNSVGRTEDNAIFLNDPSISRRHARVDYDGMVYCLHDLGSSNGTCVNDKRISGPTILRSSDRVSFGNVHFVFMPSKDQYDGPGAGPASAGGAPAMPAGGGGGKSNTVMILVIAAVGFVLLLGMVILAGAGYYLYTSTQVEEPVVPVVKELTPTQKGEKLLEDGRALMQSSRWTEAIGKFDEALALAPDLGEAKSLKKQAEKEQSAKEKLDAARTFKGKEQYEEAKKSLESVPEGTASRDQAKQELAEINQLLAVSFKKEGISALKDKDFLKAHENLVKSIELKCDEDTKNELQSLEKVMKKKRKLRGKYEPYNYPPSCR